MKTRHIDLAIATSAYCQARCSGCVWPYMESSNRVMSLQEFETILDKFPGYTFGELALNIINEPFTDKTIVQKLAAIAKRAQPIDILYFSSNWLIPNEKSIDEFVAAIARCVSADHIGRVHLNATISGIDQPTYDILQAGVQLNDAIVPYRKLDFHKAVSNICETLLRLSNIDKQEKLRFRIKSYGELYSLNDMQEFWAETFQRTEIPQDFIKGNIKIGQNESFTTFARSPLVKSPEKRSCKRHWLDKRLVIGAGGEVGLCCEDGLRTILVGNLLEQDVCGLVEGQPFQEQLSIAQGNTAVPDNHPCQRCSFYGVIGNAV